jgi:glyoxylase I family protein
MRILGLSFAGTATARRPEMVRFLTDVLGLAPARVEGVEADLFELPDGSHFAVAWPGGMGDTGRSVGFLVDDLDQAVAELGQAGLAVGPTGQNERERYVHVRAPDGELYELAERRRPVGGPGPG